MYYKKLWILLLTIICANQPHASDDDEADISQGFLLGLTLEQPLVRKSVESYIKECDDNHQNHKLVLGAGHIYDVHALHKEYQPTGGSKLTASISKPAKEKYDYHQHIGWYAISAETDEAFGSDVCCNIRRLDHQQSFLLPNTWDIIFDESFHPRVLSAPNLFENVYASLKQNGVFIFLVPVGKKNGAYFTGHDCEAQATDSFNHKIAYDALSDRFPSLQAMEEDFKINLQKIGFASVVLQETCIQKALNKISFDLESLESLESIEIPNWKIVEQEAAMMAVDSSINTLLAVDPIFEHVFGQYCVVARK